MRLSEDLLSLSALLSLSSLTWAINLDCKDVRVDKQSFDLSVLGGPHTVHWIQETPPSLSNFTFTIDICKALRRTKGVPKDNECPTGTRVCGIEYDYNLADGDHMIKQVVPIAGDYPHSGRPLDPQWTRLPSSGSHADTDKEGLRVELNGGKFPFDKKSGAQQKALVEFICDRERTGLEGDEEDAEEATVKRNAARRADQGGEEDGDNDGEEEDKRSLKFISYKPEGEKNIGVLRLEWRTKYACEGQKRSDDEPAKAKGHWGFFTWFIIVLFLAIATYLIFGSWLNYNRYGARGWDLLPHGDTIRDIPYYMKDFGRKVVSTVQGGGSRGGYSAV